MIRLSLRLQECLISSIKQKRCYSNTFVHPYSKTFRPLPVGINFELLNAYRELKGDLKVPQSYIIGCENDNSSWPSKFIGFKIGLHVANIRKSLRNKTCSANEIAELNNIGFIADPRAEHGKLIVSAFQMYIDKYNNGLVPGSFKILSTDESWPEEMRGINLGKVLSSIRQGNLKHIKSKLHEMGVVVERVEFHGITFKHTLEALKAFKKVHGHLRIPRHYKIPHMDKNYSPHVWGAPLGRRLRCIRLEGYYMKYRRILKEIGVDFSVRTTPNFEKIYDALVTFKKIYGHIKVPRDYVIPTDDDRFNEATHGYKLGICVHHIRQGTFSQHKPRLLDLGIKFTVPRIKKEISMEDA